MRFFLLRLSVFACLVAVVGFNSSTFCNAQPADVGVSENETLARQLLNEAWKNAPAAHALVDNTLGEAAEGLVSLDEARVLVLTKQRRYPDALKAVDRVLAYREDDVEMRWLEVWLLLANRQHERALERMGKFAEYSAALADPQPGGFRFQHAEWLGRGVSLLEGPRRESLPAATIEDGVAAIEARLDERAKAAFRAGRESVMKEYESRNAQERNASDEERLAADRRRAAKQASLRQQESDANERVEALNRRRSQLETEFQASRTQLQAQEQEALQRTTAAADRRGSLRAEVIFIDGELIRLDLLIQAERDPLLRNALIGQYNQWIVVRRSRVFDLRNQDLVFSQAERDLALVQANAGGLARQYSDSLDDLAQSRRQLDKQRTRVQRQLLDLAEPDRAVTPRARAVRDRSVAIGTYLPYPLEARRAALLESLPR